MIPGKLHLIGFQIHGIRMRRVRLYLIYNSAISVLITLSRISDVFSVKYSNPYRPLISEMKKIASFVQDNSYKRCSENSSILTCIHELRRVGYLIYVYNTLGHLGLGSIFFIPEFLIWTQMEACGVGQFCNTIVNPLVLFFDKSLILGCLWPFGICFKQHFDTRYLVFYNPSPPRMFLSLGLLWEYRIQHGANGPLYVTSSYLTWIFCRGVSGFATDCPCGVWCRGLTTCLLHVVPPFGNRILNNSWAVGLA